jgi:hypothetical protein
MQSLPWKVDIYSSGQEILCFYWTWRASWIWSFQDLCHMSVTARDCLPHTQLTNWRITPYWLSVTVCLTYLVTISICNHLSCHDMMNPAYKFLVSTSTFSFAGLLWSLWVMTRSGFLRSLSRLTKCHYIMVSTPAMYLWGTLFQYQAGDGPFCLTFIICADYMWSRWTIYHSSIPLNH